MRFCRFLQWALLGFSCAIGHSLSAQTVVCVSHYSFTLRPDSPPGFFLPLACVKHVFMPAPINTKAVTIRGMRITLWRQVSAEAKRRGMNISGLVSEVMQDYLKRKRKYG